MDWQIIFLFAIVGALAGFLAGLLGVGGGFILVPSLFFYFQTHSQHLENQMQAAITLSLAVMSVTALFATIGHFKKGHIDRKTLYRYAPGLFFGCISGALLSQHLSSSLLKLIFGTLLIFIGLYFILMALPSSTHSWPRPLLLLFGLAVGNLSTLLGIGGGIFSVPLFLSFRLSMLQAVATSSLATVITAWSGTLSYLVSSEFLGRMDLYLFLILSFASLLSVRFGVKAAYFAPVLLLRRIFGLVLVLTGLLMLFHVHSKRTEEIAQSQRRGRFFFLTTGGGSFSTWKSISASSNQAVSSV